MVKIYTKTGKEQWCLVHVEVQGYKDNTFATRMYQYFTRIYAKYQQNVLALAIYTDNNPAFKPMMYRYEFMGTELTYKFNIFKLMEHTIQSLDIADNPFSIIMLTAYQAIQKGMTKDKKQIEWKFTLVRKYLEANYKKDKIRRILHFIRYYVSFEDVTTENTYIEKLSTIIKQPTHMGIEEAILAEVASQVEAKAKAEAIKSKTEAVKKMLLRGFSDDDIMDIMGVEQTFIDNIRKN